MVGTETVLEGREWVVEGMGSKRAGEELSGRQIVERDRLGGRIPA